LDDDLTWRPELFVRFVWNTFWSSFIIFRQLNKLF